MYQIDWDRGVALKQHERFDDTVSEQHKYVDEDVWRDSQGKPITEAGHPMPQAVAQPVPTAEPVPTEQPTPEAQAVPVQAAPEAVS
jgi:hypothetical protein